MRKRHLIWVGLVSCLFLQQASAEEPTVRAVKRYERKVTDNWSVYGVDYPDRDRDDVCIAFKEWRDGSKMELVKVLKNGELYIWHRTMSWNRINEEKKDYSLRLNLYDQGGNFVDGGTVSYRLWNKNTFSITNISEKIFLKAFVNSNRMLLIPDGNVGNVQAFFDGKANEIALALADCVREYGRTRNASAERRTNAVEPPNLDLPVRAGMRDTL